MTYPLQHLSRRPELVVDTWAFALVDPVTKTYVGRAAPFGRQRIVSALPLKDGPQLILPDRMVNDTWGFALSDLSGNILGKPAVVVHRMLRARWTEDTRRVN